jgi:hypothetical protein
VAAQPHLQAYIDPGSTSMMLQGIIGGVAAVLVMTRHYWARATGRIRRAAGRPADRPEATAKHRPANIPTTHHPGA